MYLILRSDEGLTCGATTLFNGRVKLGRWVYSKERERRLSSYFIPEAG